MIHSPALVFGGSFLDQDQDQDQVWLSPLVQVWSGFCWFWFWFTLRFGPLLFFRQHKLNSVHLHCADVGQNTQGPIQSVCRARRHRAEDRQCFCSLGELTLEYGTERFLRNEPVCSECWFCGLVGILRGKSSRERTNRLAPCQPCSLATANHSSALRRLNRPGVSA